MSLFLNRGEIAALMGPADYLLAVERAFAAAKQGRAIAPAPLHLQGIGGAFHAKGAILTAERPVAALKLNGNFPGNPARGLPTIQGVILLCDGENGAVLAIMDSIEITLGRTAAASALAARCLARPDSAVLTLCGCGAQAAPHAKALASLFALERGFVWDADQPKAAAFAIEMGAALGIAFERAENLGDAARASDLIVTCTTARTPFLNERDVSPGVFIAAVGADNPDKNEIAPALMARAKVIVDVLEQCALMGDLNHALKAGAMTQGDVHADLGDVVIGAKPGRTSVGEMIVFDSTGTALQDVACAALAFDRASREGVGLSVSLA